MKILRCISAFCVRNHFVASRNVPRTLINSLTSQKSSNVLNFNQSRRTIHNTTSAFGKMWNYSREESNLVEESKEVSKFETPEDRIARFIDNWYDQLRNHLEEDPNLQVDWENEKNQSKMKLSILSKLIAETRYTKGLYEVADSLMVYLDSKIKDGSLKLRNKDLVFLTGRVALCVFHKLDHDQAIKHFEELRQKASIDGELVLDFGTCSTLITSLCRTKAWRECLKLLEVSQITNNMNVGLCSHILAAAVRENDEEVVKKMLALIVSRGELPKDVAFKAISEHKSVPYLLDLLRKNRWIITEESADAIKLNYGKFASVDKVQMYNRDCPCCNNSILPALHIPKNEMDLLRSTFFNQVFIRENDLFLNSDPEEVEKFMEFMEKAPKYDVVLDSLNIYYNAKVLPVDQRDKMLGETIRYFAKNGKNVLVLSKNHQERTLRYSKQFTRPDYPVDWFFAKNQSKDDLFMIYACLHGNEGCQVVTRDQLRNHGFQLGSEVTNIFKRWQEKHQVVFKGMDLRRNRISFMWPPRHEVVAQTTHDGTVHIPYNDISLEQVSFAHSNSWLCIKDLDSDNRPDSFEDIKSGGVGDNKNNQFENKRKVAGDNKSASFGDKKPFILQKKTNFDDKKKPVFNKK